MRTLLPLFLLNLVLSATAHSASYSIKITKPDHNKLEIKLPADAKDIPLKDSKWKCSITPEQLDSDDISMRFLKCKKQQEEMSLGVGCGRNTPHSSIFTLVEGPAVAHLFRIDCRF